MIAAGSSLGGARPKASVVTENSSLAIAKFPNVQSDHWDVSAWEKLCLDLAEKVGIVVPENRLITVLNRNVLLLDRFDRAGDARIGYISALTLVGATDGDHSASIADITEYFEPLAADPDRDLPQLFRRALFSLAVSNTDNHLRNHGFLRSKAGWAVSPAFDINPNPSPATFAIAMAPRGHHRESRADAKTWAELFRLTESEADEIAEQINDAVSDWQRHAELLGISANEIELLRPAFRRL
jgi:serine/threonine-protein kinase HipA